MRTKVLAWMTISTVVCVAGLSLAGCGGDDGGAIVAEDRLDGALLTLEDFDDEWSEDMRGVFTSREEGPPSFDPSGWCPQAQADVADLDRIEELAGNVGAAVEFRHERRDARRMFHGISQQVWSNDNVSKYFDVISRAFTLCAGTTWNPEPDQEVTVSTLEGPELGNESLAVNVTITTPGPDGEYLWKSRLAVVVIESSLMIVRDLDVQRKDAEPFMDDMQWWDLVDTAMGHFTAVAAGE